MPWSPSVCRDLAVVPSELMKTARPPSPCRRSGLGGRAVRVDEDGFVGPVPANFRAQLDAAVRHVGQRGGYLVVLHIGTGRLVIGAEVEVVLVVEHLRARREAPLPVEVVG